MITPPPVKFPRRKRRRAPGRAPDQPLTGAPILIAAEYLAGTWVRLTFDRPISAPAAIVGDELFVDDGPATAAIWSGGAITVLGPAEIEVALVEYDESAGTTVTLSASAATGIVSAFDGTAWAGVSGVGLPFP